MKKIINLKLLRNNIVIEEYNNVKAIFKNDSYLFNTAEVKMTINKKKIIRESEEFKFELDIEKKESRYLLKQNNMLFDIDVEKVLFKEENNNIIIEYKISTDEESLKIILEEKGDLNE